VTIKPSTLTRTKLLLTIAWLYPELMSTYGDRGNIIVLKKIANDNGIDIEILRIDQNANNSKLKDADFIFMGGAQDLQQEIVNKDLNENKSQVLTRLIKEGTPGLYVCGAYQFLGKYYKDKYGNKIEGLGVFDMHTESFKTKSRLIGNVVTQPLFNIHHVSETNQEVPTDSSLLRSNNSSYLVGFENHGGRTYLGKSATPFAKVIHGYGNNGEDKTEGIQFLNSFGTYMHGPILPSNPEFAIYLLEIALVKKYSKRIEINFDNSIAQKAKLAILSRLNV